MHSTYLFFYYLFYYLTITQVNMGKKSIKFDTNDFLVFFISNFGGSNYLFKHVLYLLPLFIINKINIK